MRHLMIVDAVLLDDSNRRKRPSGGPAAALPLKRPAGETPEIPGGRNATLYGYILFSF